ncbi:hypothetical protein HDU96_003773, partial [Phlyctochytrium bullatum]
SFYDPLPIPEEVIKRDSHCVAQICAHVNGKLLTDVLVDTGADINVIDAAFLKTLSTYDGRPVKITPCASPRRTKGVGGSVPLLGSCTLTVSPGEDNTACRDLEFFVMKGLPRTILLGTPAVHAFCMDLLFSTNELQFFDTGVLRRDGGTPIVRRYTIPLKSYESMSTMPVSKLRNSDYSRVAVHHPEVVPPNSSMHVRCVAEFPRVVNATYLIEPSSDRIQDGIIAARTVYDHDDLYLPQIAGGQSRSSPTKTFVLSVYNDTSNPVYLFKGTVIARIPHDSAAAVIPIPEAGPSDMAHALSVLGDVSAADHDTLREFAKSPSSIVSDTCTPRQRGVYVCSTDPKSRSPSTTPLPPGIIPWDDIFGESMHLSLSFAHLLHEEAPIDYESLTDPTKFLPTRRPVKDPSDEDKMDYFKDNTIISDEDLWKQFKTDHIKSPSTLERLKALVIKMGGIFRPYVTTGTKVAGQHTIQLQPFARPPNVPPYPENAMKTEIIDEHTSKMLADD